MAFPLFHLAGVHEYVHHTTGEPCTPSPEEMTEDDGEHGTASAPPPTRGRPGTPQPASYEGAGLARL
ncbi:MAG: hypothetical protein K6B13_05925 [Prevotella sp.]|nr:hypothetical protein [Prevotella sp.]